MGDQEVYLAARAAKKAVKKAAETTRTAANLTRKGAVVLRNLGKSEQAIIRKNQCRHLLIIERSDEAFTRGRVFDRARNKKYRIRADEASARHPTLCLYDLEKNELGRVVGTSNLITCITKYDLYQGGQFVGTIKDKNSLITRLNIDFCGWRLTESIGGDHYEVTDSDYHTVMQIHRAVSARSANDYILEFDNPACEIPGLLLVMTVELSKHMFE